MRVLVTGGRYFDDVPFLWAALDRALAKHGPFTVIEGASDDLYPRKGADYWARQWAAARDLPCITVHAEWTEQGGAAGPIRNRRMRDEFRPDAGIAFPGDRGTNGMVRLLNEANIPVWDLRKSAALEARGKYGRG